MTGMTQFATSVLTGALFAWRTLPREKTGQLVLAGV